LPIFSSWKPCSLRMRINSAQVTAR
jgi:hypothetical protein